MFYPSTLTNGPWFIMVCNVQIWDSWFFRISFWDKIMGEGWPVIFPFLFHLPLGPES